MTVPRAVLYAGTLIPWAAAVAVSAAAWGIRAVGITVNYDVFIDETSYARVADNLATGRGLTLYGVPFDLHPPAGFAIMAAAIKVFSLHGSLADLIFGLRPFMALLGALTCGLAFVLVGRLTNWWAALTAAAIIALDPFEIYYDSRVMLEGPAQLATTGSLLLLAASADPGRSRRSWLLNVCGGVTGGLALCVKESFGLVLALTLALAIVVGCALERAKAAVALALMLGSYLLSELLVVLTSGYSAWRAQVGSGLLRLAGAEQTTGFNAASVHASLASRVMANGTHFGVTYLLLGSGAIAGTWQVAGVVKNRRAWSQDASPAARGRLLVALWAVAAAAYLAYATAFGTIEEQMYYLLLVPGVCTLAVGCRGVAARSGAHWRAVFAALAVAVLVADGAVWTAVHRTHDDAYRQLLAWAPRHLPDGTKVAVTEDSAQFLLQGVTLGQWNTVPELIANHVDYVLLSTELVSQGYGLASPQFERYLSAHASVAWQDAGASVGVLVLFDVERIAGARR